MTEHTIEVVGHAPFAAPEGKKLVKAIEDSGADISHRCGGNARCTTCRVEFLSEEPPMGETERDCLDEDGVLGQFRLSCQIRIDRDMTVRPLMPSKEQGWDPGPEVEE